MVKATASKFLAWIDRRFPLSQSIQDHLTGYYAPKNFNIWYYFGVFSLLVFVNQIITGIWLTMFYTPTAEGAFDSVEYIMRDVHFGWLIRYLHSTGASFFFVVIYLHVFRGMLYGSYKKPRELLWIIGMLILIIIISEAFLGYLLPWGQMSYWGAQVIISLFGAIPFIGEGFVQWIKGGYNVSGPTLHRFYALHVSAWPIMLTLLVLIHIVALRHVGSNNPDGVEIKATLDEAGHPVDGVPFHPYYTVKDLFGICVMLTIFFAVVFFAPMFGGYFLEPANYLQANPLQTPEHIAPVWYMTPFYAILRAVPDKFLGIMAMVASIFIGFLLPWLDRSPVRSIRYRGWQYKWMLFLFVVSFIGLGYLGIQTVTPGRTLMARVLSVTYFAFFLLMPLYTRFEKPKPIPERLT